jgi:HK97 family phage major capsid protein
MESLLGLPVVIANTMPLPTTANATPILLGDLSQYVVATGGSRIVNIRERFIEQQLQGLILHQRIASGGQATGSVVALKLAAS